MLRALPFHRLTIRTALFLGFGLTLGIWVYSGYSFSQRMADVREQSEAINRRYMRSQDLLSTVRTQVLLGAVYVRDALLDAEAPSGTDPRQQLEAALALASSALAEYQPVLDTASESRRVAQLRRQIDDFRAVLYEILAEHDGPWPDDVTALLRDRIMPKREAVVRVAEEVQSLNRAAFIEQQRATAQVYATNQRQIVTQLGVALLISFLIGLAATRHVASLETDLRAQQERDARNTRDLQRLSAQLITAQEEERRTIARELHDEVGQVLTAIKVELAVAQHRLEAAGGSPTLLADARSVTEGAVQTVRDLSRLLHPALLDDLGLPAAVEAYIREFRKRHELAVELVQERMTQRLPQSTEVAAYRIIQESLNNVIRHARATRCRVSLRGLPRGVLIVIEDDGVGFDVETASTVVSREGLGLLGMRERAAQLGGTARFDSRPGHGARISIELPGPDVVPATPGVPEGAPSATEPQHA